VKLAASLHCFRGCCLLTCWPCCSRHWLRAPVVSASSSDWRSSYTELFTALHLSTYRANCSSLLICRRDVEADCARLPPVCSTSVRRDLSLSAIAHLLLPDHDCGAVYLSTSSLPHHSFRQKPNTHLFRQSYRYIVLAASP